APATALVADPLHSEATEHPCRHVNKPSFVQLRQFEGKIQNPAPCRFLEWAHTLTQMGLDPDQIKATAMIRTLERDQMGAPRDHFFHSFQNYFLGLTAIAQLKKEFLSFKSLAKVNWNVEPADVWFLTALWHDVGYAGQKYSNLYAGAFGNQEDEE